MGYVGEFRSPHAGKDGKRNKTFVTPGYIIIFMNLVRYQFMLTEGEKYRAYTYNIAGFALIDLFRNSIK